MSEEKSEQKNNTGGLFPNNRRRDNNDPELQGSATICGTEFWVSAWGKKGGRNSKIPGERFYSLSFRRKDEELAKAADAAAKAQPPQEPY